MTAERAQQTVPAEHARINQLHEPPMDRGAMAPLARANAMEAVTSKSEMIHQWHRHKLATPTRTVSAPTPTTTLMAARAVRSRVVKPTTSLAATAAPMTPALNKETAPPRADPINAAVISTAAVGVSAIKAAPTHNVGATTTTAAYPASTKTPVGTTAPSRARSIRTATDTADGRTATAATDSSAVGAA